MIGPFDRVRLPVGVELRDDELVDVVRGGGVPLNATAAIALRAATARAAAAALERRYPIGAETALRDVLRLFSELNARFLLNVKPHRGRAALAWRWLRGVPVLLPVGRVPTMPAVRRPVDTSSARSLARTAPGALAPSATLLLVTGTSVSALLLAVVGVAAPTLSVSLGLAVALVVAAHELAHLAALQGVPACVITRGLRSSVLHRVVSPRRAKTVAAAGPVVGLGLAFCLVAALALRPSSEGAAAALVFLVNAFGLTVATHDGRALCGLP